MPPLTEPLHGAWRDHHLRADPGTRRLEIIAPDTVPLPLPLEPRDLAFWAMDNGMAPADLGTALRLLDHARGETPEQAFAEAAAIARRAGHPADLPLLAEPEGATWGAILHLGTRYAVQQAEGEGRCVIHPSPAYGSEIALMAASARDGGKVDVAHGAEIGHVLYGDHPTVSDWQGALRDVDSVGQSLDKAADGLRADLATARDPAAIKELIARVEQARETDLPAVLVPDRYRAVDRAHGSPRDRFDGLPFDGVRRAFSQLDAHLVNAPRLGLSREQRAALDDRKAEVRQAERTYAGLQRRALGRTQTHNHAQALGR